MNKITTMENIKDIKIASFNNILSKLENFKYVPSIDVEYFYKNPIQAYIKEILPIKIKDKNKILRIQGLIDGFNYRHSTDYNYSENVDKNRVQEIFDKFDSTGSFEFMKSKERRYLLKFDSMWTTNNYNKYKTPFIQYLQSMDKSYKHFRQILQLYIRRYAKLKQDSVFLNLFKNMYKKYTDNKKYIPNNIQNLFKDCDLFSRNIEEKLSDICLEERRNSNISIIEILSKRYQFIKPHTELFDEIIIKICDICKNRIHDVFYFDLLFYEVLESDINPTQSGKIVSNIVTLFGRDKNIPIANLEKMKIALLNNPNYGDPRLTQITSNWSFVNSDAKHIFIMWLAKADLEFFFKVAFKGINDKHQRKPFWEKYINSRQLVESHVIWSQKHYNSEEIREEENRSNIKYKRFEYEDECSCFILRFNEIYVVEFSGYGNGVYFYSADEFDRLINLQRMLFSTTDDLKRKGTSTKQFSKQDNGIVPELRECSAFKIHHSGENGTWEKLVEKALSKYGIYRG